MKRQSLIALGIALLLGLLAVYFANIFLSRNEDKAADAAAGTSRVAVAVVPLDYGMEITPDKIRFANLPNAALPVGTYTQLNDLFPMGQKRVALRRMEVNEPILKTKISGEGQNASIAALLPDGKRAAAVRINDVSGVAGFVQPNDSVDVLITRQEPGGTSQKTDVLLQNTRVLALDQTAKNPDGTPQVAKSATLEVDPLDAQKLALAQQVGTLSLVLRKPGDEQNNPVVETISLDDLRYSYYGGARYATSPSAPAAAGLPRSVVAVPATPVRVVVRRPARPVAKNAPPHPSEATASRSFAAPKAANMRSSVMAPKNHLGRLAASLALFVGVSALPAAVGRCASGHHRIRSQPRRRGRGANQ